MTDKESSADRQKLKEEILKAKIDTLWKAYSLLMEIIENEEKRLENASMIWLSLSQGDCK